MPLHLLVKWAVVSPNSRGTVGIYIHYILYSLVLILYLKCGGGLGGGGVMFFSHFMLFPTFLENLGIQNNYFSFNVFFVFFFKVPLHLQLLVKWEVVSPNSRYREFYHEIGNIEKFPFTYWLNGRWLLQIVDIHVGNFNMKLTGRWFPQTVDRDSGNLYPIYI